MEVKPPENAREQALLRHVITTFYSAITKLPEDAQKVLADFWEEGKKLALVVSPKLDEMGSMGATQPDGMTIGISPKGAALQSRGLEILIIHEIAHAYRIAKDIQSKGASQEEMEVNNLMMQWGFENAEVRFWEIYATAPKDLQRKMKSALMLKDETFKEIMAMEKKQLLDQISRM